jgi:hypothetical protein
MNIIMAFGMHPELVIKRNLMRSFRNGSDLILYYFWLCASVCIHYEDHILNKTWKTLFNYQRVKTYVFLNSIYGYLFCSILFIFIIADTNKSSLHSVLSLRRTSDCTTTGSARLKESVNCVRPRGPRCAWSVPLCPYFSNFAEKEEKEHRGEIPFGDTDDISD